jgi:hypothetical protein
LELLNFSIKNVKLFLRQPLVSKISYTLLMEDIRKHPSLGKRIGETRVALVL